MKIADLTRQLNSGAFDVTFQLLYGTAPEIVQQQRTRYLDAVQAFQQKYPAHDDVFVYSAPGRTEIGGNHTDHQNGCVLAAAVNLDVIAIVAFHQDNVIRLKSKGYREDVIELSDFHVHPKETGTSAAIIRGIAAKFHALGVKIGGFDAYTTSNVLKGSGLSSSAAFEVLLGTIIDQHYNEGKLGAIAIAKIAQYAENVYFGKASGLMDQMVSSVGGFVQIDFADTENPQVENHIFHFAQAGYSLCITDTKGNHANLTADYVAIPAEMKHVANQFGKTVLREVEENAFYQALPKLRDTCTDREILRAAHFFAENRRAVLEADALARGDVDTFLSLVNESGASSAYDLQNLYSCQSPNEQGIPLALMMSRRILGKKGAVRVHGGGFAGTIQAFVPTDMVSQYAQEMNRIFGENSCHLLHIRPIGGMDITATNQQ